MINFEKMKTWGKKNKNRRRELNISLIAIYLGFIIIFVTHTIYKS